MSLVDLDRVKQHLRITHAEEDDSIEQTIVDAEAFVMNYVTDVGSPAWDDTTVPAQVRRAIIEVTANFWRNRGDDGTAMGPLTERVKDLLRAYRDLPIA